MAEPVVNIDPAVVLEKNDGPAVLPLPPVEEIVTAPFEAEAIVTFEPAMR